MRPLGGVGVMHIFLPIMLALSLMLSLPSYYAQNYAGIIGAGLARGVIFRTSASN